MTQEVLSGNEQTKIKASIALMWKTVKKFEVEEDGVPDSFCEEVEKIILAEAASLAYKYFLMGRNDALQEHFEREHPRYSSPFLTASKINY